MSDGPLVVQSDKTLLLEIDHPLAEECRLAIAAFAELERAPEHIHTYRITPLGLWNARAAGVDAEQVVDVLRALQPLPAAPRAADRRRRHDRPPRPPRARADDPPRPRAARPRPGRARGGACARSTSPRCSARASTDDLVAVPPAERGRLKQALLKVGWPADDQAGYVDGASYPVVLDDSERLRPARRTSASAVDTFLAARHAASSCCPCGAGKTLVGAGAHGAARRPGR